MGGYWYGSRSPMNSVTYPPSRWWLAECSLWRWDLCTKLVGSMGQPHKHRYTNMLLLLLQGEDNRHDSWRYMEYGWVWRFHDSFQTFSQKARGSSHTHQEHTATGNFSDDGPTVLPLGRRQSLDQVMRCAFGGWLAWSKAYRWGSSNLLRI